MGNNSNRSNPRVPNRYMDLINGKIKVEDLSDEEIFQGQLRDKNGKMTGRPPVAIPRQFHEQVVRELIKRCNKKMEAQVEPMIKVLQELAANPRTPADARYKAATYLMERVLGKVPDKQIITATIAKWEQGLDGLVVDVDFDEIDDIEEYDELPPPTPLQQPQRRALGGRHEDVLQG